MSDYTIVLGNKNYSSWSMRAWLALRQTGASFDEIVIPLGQPDTDEKKARHCPAGRVPVLYHGDDAIWDSLAIGEYLAERHAAAGLWPAAARARAVARSVCCEMHAGFAELRAQMPMNIRARATTRPKGDAVAADIRRVRAIWDDCRQRFGGNGPFLFGAWSLADVFFAPVVTRFETYGVDLDEGGADYSAAVLAQPHVSEWLSAAREESWSMPQYDP